MLEYKQGEKGGDFSMVLRDIEEVRRKIEQGGHLRKNAWHQTGANDEAAHMSAEAQVTVAGASSSGGYWREWAALLVAESTPKSHRLAHRRSASVRQRFPYACFCQE